MSWNWKVEVNVFCAVEVPVPWPVNETLVAASTFAGAGTGVPPTTRPVIGAPDSNWSALANVEVGGGVRTGKVLSAGHPTLPGAQAYKSAPTSGGGEACVDERPFRLAVTCALLLNVIKAKFELSSVVLVAAFWNSKLLIKISDAASASALAVCATPKHAATATAAIEAFNDLDIWLSSPVLNLDSLLARVKAAIVPAEFSLSCSST